ARAASLVAEAPKRPLPDAAFAVLDSVNNGASQWHIVYDPGRLRLWFRTRADPRVKSVDLARLAADCAAPVKTLDLAVDAAGDVTARFADYGESQNRRLVEKGLADAHLPATAIDFVARYPSLLRCATAP